MTDSEDCRPADGWEDIGRALAGITSHENEFVVLSKGDDEAEFIQASIWNQGMVLRPSYIMEVRTGGRFYRTKTKDFNNIYGAFRSYYDGWDPIVKKWDDVTDEISE